MNKFYKLLTAVFFFALSFNTCFSGIAPTFNCTVKNITTVPRPAFGQDSIVQWEVWLQQTNYGPGVDEFEYCCGQFTFLCDKAVQNGNMVLALNTTGTFTELPASLRPPTFQVDSLTAPAGRLYLKGSGNLPQSGVNFFISPTFPGTRIVTFRLRTNQKKLPMVPFNLRFKLGPAPNTFFAYFVPFGTQDSEANPNQTAVALMDTVANPYSVENAGYIFPTGGVSPTANFYTNTRTISAGGSVNFIDSSLYTPTSWSWTFPGGTPGTSTLSNPTGIVYNTPGTYSVSLTASNIYGPSTNTKTNYITVNPTGCTTTWKNTIKISDAANIKDSLILGTSLSATNGIDTCLGETSLPPIPPTGAFDVRFLLPNPPTNDASKKDFRYDPSNDMYWTMAFQPSSAGYPITFTWDNTAFPSTGLFYLKDQLGGIIVNVNMKNQNSYTLTNPGITSLKIEFSYFITMPVSVNTNWNIISVPLKSVDMSVNKLFQNAASLAYKYSGTYVPVDSLVNGKGYWLKFNRDTTYNQLGLTVYPKNIPVSSGWNLIGPFDENIPVNTIISTPPGIVTSAYYKYSNAYSITDTLKKGKGYWVQASASGILMKNTSDNNPSVLLGDSLNNFTKIIVTDNDNNSSTLYLAKTNQITQNYDLPPVPPSGIFDIRFGSDKLVESFGQNHNIKLNSTSFPYKIKITNIQNHRLRIVDAVTGNLFNKVAQEGAEIEMNMNLDNLVLIEEGILPVTYNLSQNYPNPFNPSTTIKYQIPSDGNVRIVIYDILGKEVQLLVNGFEKAGNYQITFNAMNLASGVYFYKMQSGSFSDMKRMLILK